MPDITMCRAERDDKLICPMREKCYRFTAKPNEFRQSYFIHAPWTFAQGDHWTCEVNDVRDQ